MTDRIRGFERVSVEQWEKDTSNIPHHVHSYWRYEDLTLPRRKTKLSAGYDFFSPWSFELNPGDSLLIPTGIKAFMGAGEVLEMYPRSGLGFKYKIRLANTVGIIDADYYGNEDTEGHIYVKICNEGNLPLSLKKGDGFAQGIFKQVLLVDGDSHDSGDDRKGGLGSTDKK